MASTLLRQLENLVCRFSPRRANLLQNARVDGFTPYFKEAEPAIDQQWDEIIVPIIKDFDFSVVLELAPGAGRNTEKLCALADHLYAVDLNEYALDRCRERFGGEFDGCTLEYIRNHGADLPGVPDGVVTTFYCWDSAVHFERSILADYIPEFARVLAPGGRGFLHHSNLGLSAHRNMKQNHGCRTNADAAMVRDACLASGLEVPDQHIIPWGPIEDCITIFAKPA